MHQLRSLVFPVLAIALIGGACSADGQTNKAIEMSENQAGTTLVVGLEAADRTLITTDVIFFIRNEGDTAMRVLIWNSPLERTLSADVFTVTLDGLPVSYQGRMIKRSTPSDEDYLTIAAHDQLEVQLDMADYYDLSASGEYAVSFSPPIIDGQAQLNESTPVLLDAETLTIRVESQ